MSHPTAPAGDHALDRRAGFWMLLQWRIRHLLLHFKTPGLLPLFLRNGFVSISGHRFVDKNRFEIASSLSIGGDKFCQRKKLQPKERLAENEVGGLLCFAKGCGKTSPLMANKHPLKILHLTGEREDAGGVLSVIRNLQSASAADGWKHAVWVNQAYKETRQPALEYRYSRAAHAESENRLRLLWQAIPATRELLALLGAEHYDVVHAHSRGALPVAMLFSQWTKRPALFTNHNYARQTGLYRWAAKRKRMHTTLLTPNMAKHYGLNAQNGRVRTISACYGDQFLQRPLAERRGFRSPNRSLRLIGVGSLIGWKKWDLLVEAIHLLPQSLREKIQCDIWGPTLQLPESRAFAAKLRQKIRQCRLQSQLRLCGPSAAVAAELLQSDLFALPSSNEPCSVALMEALALGLPAIVSNSGGCPDIVKPGCGLLFQPDDPQSLKQCLEKAILAPDEFQSPANIRDSVRHRCASQVFQAYQKVYQELALPSQKRPQSRSASSSSAVDSQNEPQKTDRA